MTNWVHHVEPDRQALFLRYAADHNYQPGSGITNDQIHVMLQEMRDQGYEIDQLRRDLNDANERALGPDERASAAIQLANISEAVYTAGPTGITHELGTQLEAAVNLWRTVR